MILEQGIVSASKEIPQHSLKISWVVVGIIIVPSIITVTPQSDILPSAQYDGLDDWLQLLSVDLHLL